MVRFPNMVRHLVISHKNTLIVSISYSHHKFFYLFNPIKAITLIPWDDYIKEVVLPKHYFSLSVSLNLKLMRKPLVSIVSYQSFDFMLLV